MSAVGSDYGHKETPGLNVTAFYALQTYATPSGYLFNYGDTNEVNGTGGMDGMRTSANLLSLTHIFPAIGNGPAYFARRLLATPAPSVTGGFDEAVVALLRWTSDGSAADLAALPHQAVYLDKQVAVARSGWNNSASYLGVKGGNSAMTHQDLDHGSFVFETSGHRWVCDLGIENYLLAGMFGSSAWYSPTNFTLDREWGSRYAYYRKATRGHNTLTFDEVGDFDPTNAAASDQAVNVVSNFIRPIKQREGDSLDVAGRFISVNLTRAYSRQLGDGGSVVRSFTLANAMSCLTITDEIRSPKDEVNNVSFTIHTRANVTLSDSDATLRMGGNSLRIHMTSHAVSIGKQMDCTPWRALDVQLPTDQQPAASRFPVRGAMKVWVTCTTSPGTTPLASHADAILASTVFRLITTMCEE
jgi:hypothetical protein